MEKFFQIFHDFHFDISFADALLLMPNFASTIKSLLTNKDKLFELAKVPLNENCSAMLLKKLLEKLGDPDKFLIPCDFLGMDVCHALADLGASINLMPLSIWKKLSLLELTPTQMSLELVDRSITQITLRVNDESVTFNLNQTMRYSSTYDDNSVNQIDVIDISCEEYAQDVLDFKYNSKIGNPTLVSNHSLSKETKRIEDSYYDPEGDVLYLEKLLNDDPSQLPPMDLKQVEETKAKS
nr:reverse transcriptase domain-containing protein [Tanacetum cinerariifolium]